MQARGSGAIMALLLTGCAQVPPAWRLERPVDVAAAPPAQLALSLDAAAPLMAVGDEPLFAGEVSLRTLDALLSLRSGYVLRAGDLLTPAEAQRWRANLLPATLGRQRIGQEARVQLPVRGVAPLMLVLRDERESLWSDENAVDTRRHGMDLQWAPAFAQMLVQWDLAALPWDARSALDCPLRGRVSVPFAGHARAEFGSRSCQVGAMPGQLDPQAAQTWSAGVQWRASERRTGLRVLTVDAETQATNLPAQAYEVGVEHEGRAGPWTARGGLAWRRTPVALGDAQDWSMDAALRRSLGIVAVSAQWQSGDRYWFTSDYTVPADNLALNLDLSTWLARQWPGEMPTLELSYQWHSGANDWRDESLQWRLWMPW